VSEVEGIDVERVTDWIAQRTEITPPLTFSMIEGGRSNLTYAVADAGQRKLILRRPPLHSVLESAHDMGREHRIIAALEGSGVPVPPTVGYEPDPDVNGAPFYVMDFVEGTVIRDAQDAREHLVPEVRGTAADELIDVLVRLHEIDPDDVGLGDLGRKEDYLARQLRRWHSQLEKGRTRDVPILDEVHERLVADIPEQGPAAIVHGDYKLENVILDPETGKLRAVLDWELTTLGDPLADVGLLLVYWGEEHDTEGRLGGATAAPGFPSRAEVVRRYAERSGRDVSQIDYYYAFGTWKLACILEGVYARYTAGAYGDEASETARGFGDLVVSLGEVALEATRKAGR
jgi:aminoglycoside phosphotransferase (APT) family kinase protein